jgi:hypothetical protein
MHGTGMEKEAEIFCYKHNQQKQLQEHHCKEMSRHTDLLSELETSLLTWGIQIGEMSKLGWLSYLDPPPQQ